MVFTTFLHKLPRTFTRLLTKDAISSISSCKFFQSFRKHPGWNGSEYSKTKCTRMSEQFMNFGRRYLGNLGCAILFFYCIQSCTSKFANDNWWQIKEARFLGKPLLTASSDLNNLTYYKYVVIGTGVAVNEAIKTIRLRDPEASLLLLPDCMEELESNVSISELLQSVAQRKNEQEVLDVVTERIIVDKDETSSLSYVQNAIKEASIYAAHSSYSVEGIDVHSNQIRLTNGKCIHYGKLLLSPCDYQRLPWDTIISKDAKPYVNLRIWEVDQSELCQLVDQVRDDEADLPHITVVGGGWNALRYVSKLKRLGFKVTMVFPEPAVLARYLPKYMSDYVSNKLKAKGVDLVSFALIRYISCSETSVSNSQLKVHISRTYDSTNNAYFYTDYVFFIPTHMPNGVLRWIDSLEDIIEVDHGNGGVVCNSELLTFSDVYVAGSAVSFPSKVIGRRREQGYDHAAYTGRIAAENMTGGRECYGQYIPMTKIDMDDICLSMFLFGDIQSAHDCSSYFVLDKALRQEQLQKEKDWHSVPIGGASRYFDGLCKGVIFFLRDEKVVGISLLNIEDKNIHEIARNSIRTAISVSDIGTVASQLLHSVSSDSIWIEKSSTGRSPKVVNNNIHSSIQQSHPTVTKKNLITSLDPQIDEVLWEIKDYFASGRTQSDIRNQAFKDAIFRSAWNRQGSF